jgi:HAD superfamily hydrolase (TIGR01509 family)
MALDAVLFDVDGTLVDTNPAHVEAWRRAFAAHGYAVASDRIAREVGQGGDRVVPSILGAATAAREGDLLRQTAVVEFLALSRARRFPVFPGVRDLFAALRRRGIRTALATSSNPAQLAGLLHSTGLHPAELVDAVITCDDVRITKPAPDTVLAAALKLGLSPAQCAYVGDTPYDAQAARAAGVVPLGVLTGGYSADALTRAGARRIWRDPAALLADLDSALEIASPGPGHLTLALLESLMREALGEGRAALEAGEMPIGAVLARGDGTIVARGRHDVARSGNRTAHAEMVAFARAAHLVPADAHDLVLVSTLEPCPMCTGAAIAAGVDTIVYGFDAPTDHGTRRVTPPEHADSVGSQLPRIVGSILPDESRALFDAWRDQHPWSSRYTGELTAGNVPD